MCVSSLTVFREANGERITYPALAEVQSRLSTGAIEALTTDVFDTVVWRTVPEPVDAFAVVGGALRDRGALDERLSPRCFAAVRERCETIARSELHRADGGTEVRLDEIWRLIPAWCHAPLSRDEAIEVELEVEGELLVADLEVLSVIRAANRAGIPVHAVSDTYFSPAQLRALLRGVLPEDVEIERIFTSSERRTGKADGLFDAALAAIGCPPQLVAHLGDNPAADIEPARRRGLLAAHVPRRSARLEEVLHRESAYGRVRGLAPADAYRSELERLDGSLVQLRAKASLRAEADDPPSALRPMWLYGAEVLGAPFAGFADWVVEEAGRLGARRVHCLMREGSFLAELIAAAAAAAGSDLEAEPLFLNRQVAAVAAIGAAEPAELEPLLSRRDPPTARELLEALGVPAAMVPALAGSLDGRLDDGPSREAALEAICGDAAVRGRVGASARELRERVVRMIRSLHEEGEPFVLVDLGWAASIQRGLSEIAAQAGLDLQIDGLYLLTHERAVDAVAAGGRVSSFLAAFGNPEPVAQAVLRSPEVLEQVCMPDQGTQVGLSEDLEPLLAPALAREDQAAEAAAVRDGIRAFQRSYLRYREAFPERLPSLATRAGELGAIVARACVDPTDEEATRFGAWRHDAGQGCVEAEPLTSGPLAARLRHLAPEQLLGTPMSEAYWPSAVARLHDPHLADLCAAQAAGLLREGAGSTELETGELLVEPCGGLAVDPNSALTETPRRNRHGLSHVRATLRAAHVERVRIRLGERPALVRLDDLSITLHLKGSSETPTVRLATPEGATMLDLVNVVRVSERVLAGTADHSFLEFRTERAAPSAIVYRADVEISFMAMAWDARSFALQPGDQGAGRRRRDVLASVGRGATRPLRALRRRLGAAT